MKRFNLKYTILVFGMLMAMQVMPGHVVAQQPVSLSEAIEMTLARNFDIRLEQARAEVSQNNNNWGQAGRYPNISLQLNSNNRISTVDNPASFINGTFNTQGGTGTVNVAWNIFAGNRVNITKARLEELERLSEGNVALVVENSLQAVVLQYYAALIEQERVASLEANLALSRDRYNYVNNKRDLGTGTTFELLTVESAYLADSSALLQQELSVQMANRQLSQLIGLPPDSLVTPNESLKTDFSAYDAELLRSKMFSNNLTLRNQFINLEILQKDVALARANQYPAISVDVGSNYSLSRFDLQGRDPAGGSQIDYYANFSLNFTLYNGGMIKRAIRNSLVNEKVAELGIGQMEQSMDYQLQDAVALYNTRRKVLNVVNLTMTTAKQNLEIAEVKFRNGTLSSFDYRDVQVAYLGAVLSRSQALFNVMDAEVALLRLTGGILDMGK